jgi:hypothetical protein
VPGITVAAAATVVTSLSQVAQAEPVTVVVVIAEALLLVATFRRRRSRENVLLIPLALAIGGLQFAIPPIAVAAAIGYAASVIWRVAEVAGLNFRILIALRKRGIDVGWRPWFVPPIVVTGAICLALAKLGAVSALALIVFLVLSWQLPLLAPRGWPKRQIIEVTAYAVEPVAILAVVLTVATGYVQWANPALAKDVLPQVIAVQVALGLIPLTLLTFAAQFIVGSSGVSAYVVLPYRRTLAAIAVVVASIGWDIVLLGAGSGPGDIELAQMFAAVAIATALLASLVSLGYLRLERTALALVGRLDRRWLRAVGHRYQDRLADRIPNDPFGPVERLLYIAATRDSDIRLFRSTVGHLYERLRDLVQVEGPTGQIRRLEVAMDEYLALALPALVQDVAKERKTWALQTLVSLRHALEDDWLVPLGATPEAVGPRYLERTFFDNPPSGLQFYGLIAEQSLESGMDHLGWETVIRVAAFSEKALMALPDPTGVHDIDPAAPIVYQGDAPAQHAADGIDSLLSHLSSWAKAAAETGRAEMLHSVAFALKGLTDQTLQLEDARWTGWIAARTARVAYEVATLGIAHGQDAYSVPAEHRHLSATRDVDREFVNSVTVWSALSVASSATVVSWSLLASTAVLAMSWLPDFLEEAAFLAASIEYLREKLGQLPATPERSYLIEWCDRRLNQVCSNTKGREADFDAARTRAVDRLRGELEPPIGGGGEVH